MAGAWVWDPLLFSDGTLRLGRACGAVGNALGPGFRWEGRGPGLRWEGRGGVPGVSRGRGGVPGLKEMRS